MVFCLTYLKQFKLLVILSVLTLGISGCSPSSINYSSEVSKEAQENSSVEDKNLEPYEILYKEFGLNIGITVEDKFVSDDGFSYILLRTFNYKDATNSLYLFKLIKNQVQKYNIVDSYKNVVHGNIIQDAEHDILVAIFSGKNIDFFLPTNGAKSKVLLNVKRKNRVLKIFHGNDNIHVFEATIRGQAEWYTYKSVNSILEVTSPTKIPFLVDIYSFVHYGNEAYAIAPFYDSEYISLLKLKLDDLTYEKLPLENNRPNGDYEIFWSDPSQDLKIVNWIGLRSRYRIFNFDTSLKELKKVYSSVKNLRWADAQILSNGALEVYEVRSENREYVVYSVVNSVKRKLFDHQEHRYYRKIYALYGDKRKNLVLIYADSKNKDFTSYDVFEILEEKTTAD
jgi:hypothetical protein